MSKKFPLLSSTDIIKLNNAVLFFNMQELKRVCEGFGFSSAGKKMALITRITTYIETGEIVLEPVIPAASRAQRGEKVELTPHGMILHGSFKNDAATRAFLKTLVGNHFHYTAFGLDWINERWLAGNPPTFAQFAQFWQIEFSARKKQKAPLKKEWALLNFVAAYIKKYPAAPREEVVIAWKHERALQVEAGMEILRKALK